LKLTALQRQWDAWGREDPLWAAVTRTDKLGRRWDVEEFLQTGRDEVDFVLRHLGELGAEVPRGRALDFGCGVGRFTQALAERFDRADGVDISPSMLDEARRLNRRGERCRYHLNARDDLSLFPDGSFPFAFSMLVLQHVRPRHAKRYLEELLRVLAPGGALVFQVPAEVPPGASGTAGGTVAGEALPASAFRARISPSQSRLSLKAGEVFLVEARIENVSAQPWPGAPGPGGLFHVQLANRWLYPNGAVLARDDSRTALPFDLHPGQELATGLYFVAPAYGGEYLLELDMVQEGVAWFAERGSPTARIPCTVDGGLRPAWAAPAAVMSEPLFAGFRARHPKLHGALRRAGLVPLYHVSVAAARRLRDRWRRWRRSRLVMEMHALPRAEVEQIIAAGGGALLEVESERWPNGIVSARYWVVKPLSAPPGSAA
jgi:SAM-dependent methyltransferase